MTNDSSAGREWVRLTGRVVGLTAAVAIAAAPHFGAALDGERPELNRMAAVAVLMAVWWMTEAIPLAATALLPLALFPLLSIMPARATALGYGDSLIFLFLGGFILALGVERSGLHRRVALAIVAAMGDAPRRVVLGFMLATALLSMWISNTASALLLTPIALSVLYESEAHAGARRDGRFGTALLLGIAYAASIGGCATLIGTPPNVAMKQIHQTMYPAAPEITFGGWMLFAVPLAVVFLALAWLTLTRILFPLTKQPLMGGAAVIAKARRQLGPVTSGEIRMAGVMTLTALLWIFREPIAGWGWAPALGVDRMADGATRLVDDATVAMLMAVLCFVLPSKGVKGPPLMDWETAVKLPWGVLLLFGGGIALARGMTGSGLDRYLGEWFGRMLTDASPLAMVAATALGMTFFTELTSNLASVQMSLPILGRVAQAIGHDPRLLIVPATLSCSFAFMLPVATPPNAIVFGSGRLEIRQMVWAGFVLNLMGVALTVLAVFLMIMPLMGIADEGLPPWAVETPAPR